MEQTIPLYCVVCGSDRTFGVALDLNGDFLATCPTCQHGVKFPGSSDLASLVVTHNEQNRDQVKVDDSGQPVMSADQQAALAAASTVVTPTPEQVAAQDAQASAPAPETVPATEATPAPDQLPPSVPSN